MFSKTKFLFILISAFIVCCAYIYCQRSYPKVSIILPIYNGAKDIRQTIPYILSSEFEDFEFIIIDDCSTDDTWKILQEFAQKDNRIRIFRNEKNLGISKTRNRGINLSHGKYLAMMDHDDISLPQRIKVSVAYLDEHQDTDIVDVGTILKQAYDKGIRTDRVHILDYALSKRHKDISLYSEEERDENIKIALMYSLAIPTQSASMIRKEFLDNHNIKYREDVVGSDDYYLYLDMVKAGAKFHHILEILHIYNDTPHHNDKFNHTQYKETLEAKRQLYEWSGLDYSKYADLEKSLPPEDFVCILLRDLIAANQHSKRYSSAVLQKDYKLICSGSDKDMKNEP